jgi:hypothetical protein
VNHEKKNCDMDDLFRGSHRLDWVGFRTDSKASGNENGQIAKRPRSF